MGQAKQRGSFEQRKASAIARNKVVEAELPPRHPLQKFRRKHGTQRLVTRLVMAGMLAVAANPQNKSAGIV